MVRAFLVFLGIQSFFWKSPNGMSAMLSYPSLACIFRRATMYWLWLDGIPIILSFKDASISLLLVLCLAVGVEDMGQPDLVLRRQERITIHLGGIGHKGTFRLFSRSISNHGAILQHGAGGVKGLSGWSKPH